MKNTKNNYKTKEFNDLVDRIMDFSDVCSIFDEIAYNWLKHQAEKMRNNDNFLCCKTIFFKD